MSALEPTPVANPRIWALPPVAEAVEKVRTIKFCATIVRVSRAYSNIDSTKSLILKHCFKTFERPDFFNTLSHKLTSPEPSDLAAVRL